MSDTGSKTNAPADALSDPAGIAADIRTLRAAAKRLHRLGDAFPAVSKNAARILASLKMIELNVFALSDDPDSPGDQ